MNRDKIADLRKQYGIGELKREDLLDDPIKQFQSWFGHATELEVPEPNAMSLATIDRQGRPSARIVLLKGLDERGFIFYTNYESQKGQELTANPQASLNFLWHKVERQVRVQGKVERLSEKESTDYFHSRPKGSQLGAWASPQSSVIAGRAVLEEQLQELQEKYAAQEQIPKPPHWGGFLLRPAVIEFWQGRNSRLHDRFVYERLEGNDWNINRLAP